MDVSGLGKIAFLLIGYKEDVDNFFSTDTSARRYFDIHQLGVMPNSEVKQIFEKGFKEAEVKFDDSQLSANIGIAGGYPHSVQILGHVLIEGDKDGVINENDWNDALFDAAMYLQSKEFSNMYSFSKKLYDKDEIIAFMASKNVPMSRKELANQCGIKNIYQHIPKLLELGAIKQDEEGKLSLHSQLFVTAVRVDQIIRRMDLKKRVERQITE